MARRTPPLRTGRRAAQASGAERYSGGRASGQAGAGWDVAEGPVADLA